MRKITEIILHCSDSNIQAHDNIETIDQWHKDKGWSKVGYHYFIRSNGMIEFGRDLDEIGAHCSGHNENSIGICLHGKHKSDFTREQKASLYHLIKSLVTLFPKLKVYGHNEFNSKKRCPVFDVEPFKSI